MKKKLNKEELIEHEEKYVVFLQKQVKYLKGPGLSSTEYTETRKNMYEKYKKNLDKAKLKLKFLKEE